MQSARPFGCKGPCLGRPATRHSVFGCRPCWLPLPSASDAQPERLPGPLPRLFSGSERSRKLDAIDCALWEPKGGLR